MGKTFLETPLTPELCCSDLQTSRKFYVDILGFTIQYERQQERFAMLERQGSRLMLDEIIPGQKRSWVTGTLEKPYGRGMNLQMQTTDVRGLYDQVRAAGANIFLPLEEKWYRADDVYLGNRQFIVQDPDGYLLRFFEDLGERSTPG